MSQTKRICATYEMVETQECDESVKLQYKLQSATYINLKIPMRKKTNSAGPTLKT